MVLFDSDASQLTDLAGSYEMKRWAGCTATLLSLLRNRGMCDEMPVPKLRHVSSPAVVRDFRFDAKHFLRFRKMNMRQPTF
jgi:hypothetical protein